MSLQNWVSNTAGRLREDGVSGLTDSFHLLYNGAWRICGAPLSLGTNIYEREWELLVLLDGCRVDTLETFEDATDTDCIDDVGRLRSVASTSREWLAKTFVPEYREEVGRTAYVTANPYTDEILSNERQNRSPFNPANWGTLTTKDFLTVEEVWRDGWDENHGTVLPRIVTDRVIAIDEELDPERLVVHYMQPHQPFIGENAKSTGDTWVDGSCWESLRRGEASKKDVQKAYTENLSVVLDDVEILLKNIDADPVVITSDHGNAFGEWGIYGHPNGFLHPSVKDVPWAVTEAVDQGTYEPDSLSREHNGVDRTTEDRLQDLGYI